MQPRQRGRTTAGVQAKVAIDSGPGTPDLITLEQHATYSAALRLSADRQSGGPAPMIVTCESTRPSYQIGSRLGGSRATGMNAAGWVWAKERRSAHLAQLPRTSVSLAASGRRDTRDGRRSRNRPRR